MEYVQAQRSYSSPKTKSGIVNFESLFWEECCWNKNRASHRERKYVFSKTKVNKGPNMQGPGCSVVGNQKIDSTCENTKLKLSDMHHNVTLKHMVSVALFPNFTFAMILNMLSDFLKTLHFYKRLG